MTPVAQAISHEVDTGIYCARNFEAVKTISLGARAIRNSANQINVNLTQLQAIENLSADGFSKAFSKDGVGDFDMTPLHYAYMGGKEGNIKLLLALGADPLAKCDRGFMPHERPPKDC